MLEKKGESTYQSEPLYQIEVTIKGEEYTNYLTEVRIVSILSKPYPWVLLSLYMEAGDIILNDVMENDKIDLKITFNGLDKPYDAQEETNIELQCLNCKHSVGTGYSNSESSNIKPRTDVHLLTVPRKAYKTMNQTVNKNYANKTAREILDDLIKTKTEAELQYDTDNENTEPVKQLCLPGMNIAKLIKSLDDNYGLYEGASNCGYCKHDNTLCIYNLTAKIQKNQTFTVYQMGSASGNDQDLKKCNDGKHYHTTEPLRPKYNGTSTLSALSSKIVYNTSPRDNITKKTEINIDSAFVQQYGVLSDKTKSEIKLDKNLNSARTRYVHSHSGNGDSETFAKAKIARQLAGLAEIGMTITKPTFVMNLMNVGEPTKLTCDSDEYKNLEGKYILKSSDILFSKTKGNSNVSDPRTKTTSIWNNKCDLTLMRTNQYS
jgi:hypothetical protein